MVFHLLNQSKILDECLVQVAQAISKAMSRRTTQLFQPFTTYISGVSDAVKAWHRKVTLIHPEMAHCNYDTYRTCSGSVQERMNKFLGKLWDLNTHLNQQTLSTKLIQGVKPNDKGDSRFSSSVDVTAPGSS